MAKQREIFTEGAVNRGVDPVLATHIFDIMEKFSGYGFNKSHSAAYALVSYQTAWLKTHFPAPFMAAVLTADMSNTEKVVIMLEEAKKMGLEVLAPNIYESEYAFTCISDKTILYGLGAIKGVGEGAILEIIEKRKKNIKFDHFFDFCSKIDPHKVNRRVLEALIFSGAFDCLEQDRAVMAHYLEEGLKYSQQESLRKSQKQQDLFGAISNIALTPMAIAAGHTRLGHEGRRAVNVVGTETAAGALHSIGFGQGRSAAASDHCSVIGAGDRDGDGLGCAV